MFVVVCAIAGGVSIYTRHISREHAATNTVLTDPLANKTQSPSSPTVTLPKIEDTVASIKAKIASDYAGLEPMNTPDNANTIGYPLAGYSFSVLLPYAPTTAVSFNNPSSTNEATAYALYQKAIPAIRSILQSAGYALSTTAPSQANGLQTKIFYERADAYCQIVGYSLLDVTCDKASDIIKIAQDAQPLVAAYNAVYPPTGSQTVLTPEIQASKTAGYSIATIAIYDETGETKHDLYKQGNGGWQVVNAKWYNDPQENANIQRNCGYFESLSATRQAYAGQPCYNSSARKMSVVM